MFKGFYNLTSGVLTHQRNLDVVANNMVNISTPGYKQERYLATTFDEVMYSRVGNNDGQGEELGGQSYIRATSDIITEYQQGTLEPTGMPLDFAIQGEGFFAVRGENGDFYTRAGNFSLDNEGYLCFSGFGRVLNTERQPIQLGTDKIIADEQGIITHKDTGEVLGQLGVFVFNDNAALERNQQGFFIGEGAQLAMPEKIAHQCVERSNTDIVRQMTDMMTYQRSLQSAAQVMKMYDNLMTKATGEVGRL